MRLFVALQRHPELSPSAEDEDSEDEEADAADLPSEEIGSALINGQLALDAEMLEHPLPVPVGGSAIARSLELP